MKLPKIQLAQTVVSLCHAKGIEHVVISPGSRNAPLTIGFTNSGKFKTYSIVDERVAAFFALGIAQKTRRPVALVCTSGSAVLNYYPAVAEAFYSEIPLVVISADRPKYLIGVGDGQTIDQKNVFGHHSLYNANLKEDVSPDHEERENAPKIIKSLENKLERFIGIQKDIQRINEEEINKALNIALTKRGPVHLNVPFKEPLYETVDSFSVKPEIINAEVDSIFDEDEFLEFLERWNSAEKKMLLVGVNRPNAISEETKNHLAHREDLIVFTETTSNLNHEEFFPSIDKIIAPLNDDELKKLKPDLLITMGGMVVSKKVKAFLRKYQPKWHWHIGKTKALDTYFKLEGHLNSTQEVVWNNVFNSVKEKRSDYKSFWQNLQNIRREKHKEYLDKIPFTDLKVFQQVLNSLPKKCNLQLGNSATIRYAQLFDLRKDIEVYCNRGTSGIDGSTSTAIGSAVVSDTPTVIITGDLSFFYDSNALWNSYIPKNFRVIVINNGGGGIFRILPGHKNTENFDTYFETTHDLDAEKLCEMYGFEYSTARSENEIGFALGDFYTVTDKPKLMEVFTPRTLNDEVLLNYFEYIK